MATSSRRPPPARTILALYGPTAGGKTAVAGLLRERLGAEVVSADSASLYAGMPILTAAPPYPARLVGITPVTETMSVGAYRELAHSAIDDVLANGRLPLVVGGTGLYLRAALAELSLPPATERRVFWQNEYERLGPEEAHALLLARDSIASSSWRRAVPSHRRQTSSGRPTLGCRRRSSRSAFRSPSSTAGSKRGRGRWSSKALSTRRVRCGPPDRRRRRRGYSGSSSSQPSASTRPSRS